MNNSFINQNLNNLKSGTLDWITIQSEMKKKLGVDIYESWLKKINFVEEFNNYNYPYWFRDFIGIIMLSFSALMSVVHTMPLGLFNAM